MTLRETYVGRGGAWRSLTSTTVIDPRGGVPNLSSPVASFTMTPPSPVEAGTAVTFDGSGSTDADSYFWDDAVDPSDPVAFDTYPLGAGETLTYTWNSEATRYPRLRVVNDVGEDTETKTLSVVDPSVGAPTSAPSVSGTVVSDTRIDWSWSQVPDATGYDTSLDGGPWVDRGTSLSLVDDGLLAGQTRTLSVRGKNSAGVGPSGSATRTTSDSSATAPADWQTAWDSNDYATLRAWYRENTGPSGTLTPSGYVASQFDGEIIENLDVSDAPIRIYHDNVTVRNCRVTGNNRSQGHIYVAYAQRNDVNSLTVEDCEMVGVTEQDADGNDVAAGLAVNATYATVTIRRCRATTNYAGYRLSTDDGDLVEYSMVENIIHFDPDHNTGLSFRGGSGVRITRNWIEGNSSSALSLYPDQNPITDMVARENLFDGGSYSVLGGYGGKTYSDQLADIKVIDCKFTYNYRYGVRAAWCGDCPGNEWTGNVHLSDGTPAS